MTESYPPPTGRSSPARPDLPDCPPPKFQFNLKHLLAFMFISALVAMGIRQLIRIIPILPDAEQAAVVNVTLGALVIAGLLYYFFRAPYLAVRAIDAKRRWRAIQEHRRALKGWTKERLNDLNSASPRNGPPERD